MTRRSPLLGSNVSTVGGLERAFDQATEWHCHAIQVYTTPSRRWEVPPLDPERTKTYFDNWRRSPVRAVVAHVPFLVNAASPDPAAWERSVNRLTEEVERAEALKVQAVVLHPGSGGDSPRAQAMERAALAIQTAVARTAGSRVRVLLENMAGQGATLCGRFEEIAELLAHIDEADRTGVCFDTAHAFIAGYPLAGYLGYDQVMDEFDRIVGIEQIAAVHVNDSLTAHGSRHDRHAPVGHGEMGLEVFHALMRDPRFVGLPMLLEVPNRDEESLGALQALRELMVREAPLEPTPAGPLQLALQAKLEEAA